MLLKIIGKVLLDRNIVYSHTVYRIHGYCYCLSCIRSLFTDVLYCYYYCIIPV